MPQLQLSGQQFYCLLRGSTVHWDLLRCWYSTAFNGKRMNVNENFTKVFPFLFKVNMTLVYDFGADPAHPRVNICIPGQQWVNLSAFRGAGPTNTFTLHYKSSQKHYILTEFNAKCTSTTGTRRVVAFKPCQVFNHMSSPLPFLKCNHQINVYIHLQEWRLPLWNVEIQSIVITSNCSILPASLIFVPYLPHHQLVASNYVQYHYVITLALHQDGVTYILMRYQHGGNVIIKRNLDGSSSSYHININTLDVSYIVNGENMFCFHNQA